MEMNLSVVHSTSRETKGAIWFEGNGTRFPFEVLRKGTLCITRVPLNDARTNGLRNKICQGKRAILDV